MSNIHTCTQILPARNSLSQLHSLAWQIHRLLIHFLHFMPIQFTKKNEQNNVVCTNQFVLSLNFCKSNFFFFVFFMQFYMMLSWSNKIWWQNIKQKLLAWSDRTREKKTAAVSYSVKTGKSKWRKTLNALNAIKYMNHELNIVLYQVSSRLVFWRVTDLCIRTHMKLAKRQ